MGQLDNYCEHVYCPNGCTVRSGMCEQCVVKLKRGLAEKVLAALRGLKVDDRFSAHWCNGFGQCKGEALKQLQCIFAESGIELTTPQQQEG